MPNNTLPELDVAIIGGGVSGIYSGWRMLSDKSNRSPQLQQWKSARGHLAVKIFEGSERLGGRLLSATPASMPNTVCELGGMRYVSTQTIVRSLVENKLNLGRHLQVVDKPDNLAFLRGVHLRASQLSDPAKLPYRLDWAEAQWLLNGNNQRNGAATLLGHAISMLLPNVTQLHGADLASYLQNAHIDGAPLYQHGLWNLLARTMSSEAYALARATIGYDCLGSNANAVDLIAEYFDFTPDVTYHLLDEGYDAVPWKLANEFTDTYHLGEIETNSWAAGFDSIVLDDGTTGVSIRFHDGRPAVTARAVLLAMPRSAILGLKQDGPVLDPTRSPQTRVLVDAVEGVELSKLFVVYEKPWWESVGVTQGRSLTDLPLRQCYYWGVEGRQPNAPDPNNQHAAIMAYNDQLSTEFWGGLRRLPLGPDDTRPAQYGGADSDTTNFGKPFQQRTKNNSTADAAALRKNWDNHPAPDAMVMELHRQLARMHDIRNPPEPVEAAFKDWADGPYGGAVHFWNPGYRSWEVLEKITQPVDDFPCYICGEAWSTNQTWVEGALQTAEIVLQKRFGMDAPDWITENPKPTTSGDVVQGTGS